jgi:hypothetical protein
LIEPLKTLAPATLDVLVEAMQLEDFVPEKVKRQSFAAGIICKQINNALMVEEIKKKRRQLSPQSPKSPQGSAIQVCKNRGIDFQREYLHPSRMEHEIEQLLGEVASLDSRIIQKAREAHDLKRTLEAKSREVDAKVEDIQILLQLIKQAASKKNGLQGGDQGSSVNKAEGVRVKRRKSREELRNNEESKLCEDILQQHDIVSETLQIATLDHFVDLALEKLIAGETVSLDMLHDLSRAPSQIARSKTPTGGKVDLMVVSQTPLNNSVNALNLFRSTAAAGATAPASS